MNLAKATWTPMKSVQDVSGLSGDQRSQNYCKATGSLMYLMVGTRSDNAFLMCSLAHFVENALLGHWKAVQRVIYYPLNLKNYSLCSTVGTVIISSRLRLLMQIIQET